MTRLHHREKRHRRTLAVVDRRMVKRQRAVLCTPIDGGTTDVSEQFDDVGMAALSCEMGGCLAVEIHRLDIAAKLHEYLHAS